MKAFYVYVKNHFATQRENLAENVAAKNPLTSLYGTHLNAGYLNHHKAVERRHSQALCTPLISMQVIFTSGEKMTFADIQKTF